MIRNMLLLIVLTVFASVADAGRLKANWRNLKRTFDEGATLSYETDLDASFVITCNDAYGLIGLSDESFVGYNRIYVQHKLTSDECYDIVDRMLAKETIVYTWKKTNCNFGFYCNYETQISFQ